MTLAKTDSLGRATFHHIERRTDVRPTEREIRWLKHIERHGPQSSEVLFELTRESHRSKDTALRDLQKLRAGGYLTLPLQQRATERAEFNPYIYDLTRPAHHHLTDIGLSEPTVGRPAIGGTPTRFPPSPARWISVLSCKAVNTSRHTAFLSAQARSLRSPLVVGE